MWTPLIPSWSVTSTVLKEMNNLSWLPRIFIGNWAAACYGCGWFYPAAGRNCGNWIRVAPDSILRLTRVTAAGYDLRLSWVPTAGCNLRLTPSYAWIRVAADSILRLTRVLASGYELRMTPTHVWLEFRRLDTSYTWLHPTTDSSSGGCIRLNADSTLPLTTSCGWLYPALDSSPPAGLDLWLTYTLINQVNLRTYSAKFIIFMVCFLALDFSYNWFRLWLLLQEPWRRLKRLEEAWRSLKKIQDSSCDWF